MQEVREGISALEEALGISKSSKRPITPGSVSTRAPSGGSSVGSLPSNVPQRRKRPSSAPVGGRRRASQVESAGDARRGEREQPSALGFSHASCLEQSMSNAYASHLLSNSRTQPSLSRTQLPSFSRLDASRSRLSRPRSAGASRASSGSRPSRKNASAVTNPRAITVEEAGSRQALRRSLSGSVLLNAENQTWNSSGVAEALSRFVPRAPSPAHRFPDPQLMVPAGGLSPFPERAGNGRATTLLKVQSLTGPLLFVQ